MMLDEYVFLVMDTRRDMERDKDLQRNIQKIMKTTGEILTVHSCNDNKLFFVDSLATSKGTAFWRPAQSSKNNSYIGSSLERSEIPLQLIDLSRNQSSRYNERHSSVGDREYDISGPYLSQYSIPSYSDYRSLSNGITQSDSYVDNQMPTSYGQVTFNSNIRPGGYCWTDGYNYSTVSEPYSNNGNYNKFISPFNDYTSNDHIGNCSFQNALNRNALDSSMQLYGNCPGKGSGSTKTSTYTANFMEIAQPAPQCSYTSEDINHNEEFSTERFRYSFQSFAKNYITSAFR